MNTASLLAFCITFLVASWLWKRHLTLQREVYIRSFAFPHGVFEKVIKQHPQLSKKDLELVSQGLRQFFLAYLKSGCQYVSMPSQVADDLWHAFILYTRSYQLFSRKAFGSFLHHTPAVLLSGGSRQSNAGLRRCWRYACVEENINPLKPSRLPLLFALDSKLNIANGFHYIPDCSGIRRQDRAGNGSVHCGGDFSDASIDGGTEGMSDSTSDSDDGGNDGCGGGCGGGD